MQGENEGQSFDSLFRIPRGYVLLPVEEFRLMAQAYYGGGLIEEVPKGPEDEVEEVREFGYTPGSRPIVRNIGIDED